MTKASYRNIFILILIAVLAVRLYIVWLNVWPINGDEAQYWNWSQHLAWGYYSKPPMIAWVIALTTKLVGNNAVGLRLGSILAYIIGAVFVYLIGCRLFSTRVGFWAGITFIFVPGITFSSTIISTDPLLLMFWSIAFYCLIRALAQNCVARQGETSSESCWWWLSAIALGLAFYSKYAAILFSISLIIFLLLSKNHRYLWKSAGPYVLLLFPFVMLIPNLIWNYQHHFASVAAVSANANLSKDLFHPQNFLIFFASQFALFGPILFGILLVMLFQIKKFLNNEHYKLLWVFTLVTLGIMTIESILANAHANWAAPAYAAATILVCAAMVERKAVIWLWAALILHILAMVVFVNLDTLENKFHLPLDQAMTITSWPKAAVQINAIRKNYPDAKILVNDRMLLTQIMYYAQIPLDQTVRWNASGDISDEYEMVTSMQHQQGKNFLLISYVPFPTAIENRFSSVKLITTINLMTLDGQTIPIYVFYLVGFKGYV